MAKALYLLDGMALAYRAHFALMRSPIFTSAGVNTSALYGFTNTLIELLKNRKPTHLAVVFDTSAPTIRHTEFPAYKAQRQEMPEDLAMAIPAIGRLCEAMNIPVLALDGYEADDIIGTLAKRAEGDPDFVTYMVTPDKDFGQLVTERTFIYRPGTGGGHAEVWGVPEVCAKWEVARPEQVIDVLALWGDTTDNIPGVPGFGEKTAKALIARFGTLEALLANTAELKGKQREKIEQFAEQARFSRWLATINTNVPVHLELDGLAAHPMNEAKVKELFAEHEFNSLGRRLFGESFKAGRGGRAATAAAETFSLESPRDDVVVAVSVELDLFQPPSPDEEAPPPAVKTIKDVPHHYEIAQSPEARAALIADLLRQKSFCFDTETSSLDEKTAEIVGLSFSWEPHTAWFVPVPGGGAGAAVLDEFRPVFAAEGIEKVGHNLKFDLGVLGWHGLEMRGPFFDTMLAHALIEPDQRHAMDYLAEVYLGYAPVPITDLIGQRLKDAVDLFAQLSMADVMQSDLGKVAEYAAEDADVSWQLAARLRPLLEQKRLERVFYEIEGPLLPVLAEMERTGVLIDVPVLKTMSQTLAAQIKTLEKEVHVLAGGPFNLNSPKQLGEVLFDRLRLAEKPKKTRTGQYQTNEDTLLALASKHKIVEKILEHREATKLKGTYIDALPQAVFSGSGRVHTTYLQLWAATGRLSSNNPNLQNIPIRTPMGREIRRAFVAPEGHEILCADYSQIELRIMAAISGDAAMCEAFAAGHDIHAATASRVYGVPMDQLLPEMRRTAKMVNFGIIYGISAFGLAQRLGIGREEARTIINGYFTQYPGIKAFMDRIIGEARTTGYVETLSGRRRYLRDINSGNATVRSAAERTAINTPIQGSAADMIKIAMARIATAFRDRRLRTRMLLQVHDELVFEVPLEEKSRVEPLVVELMKNAMPLEGVPIVVDTGWGKNWLEAH